MTLVNDMFEKPGPPIPRRRRRTPRKKQPQSPPPREDHRDGFSQPGESSFSDYVWNV